MEEMTNIRNMVRRCLRENVAWDSVCLMEHYDEMSNVVEELRSDVHHKLQHYQTKLDLILIESSDEEVSLMIKNYELSPPMVILFEHGEDALKQHLIDNII